MIFVEKSSNIIDYDMANIRSISVTTKENSVNIYINGEYQTTLEKTANTSAGKIKLGTSSNVTSDGSIPDRYWKGDINSLRIYDRELSADEIKLNYLSDANRF